MADRERSESECKQTDEVLQILTELVNIAPVSLGYVASMALTLCEPKDIRSPWLFQK